MWSLQWNQICRKIPPMKKKINIWTICLVYYYLDYLREKNESFCSETINEPDNCKETIGEIIAMLRNMYDGSFLELNSIVRHLKSAGAQLAESDLVSQLL